MPVPIHARLWAVAVGAALAWGGLAGPAWAIGQVFIFRDPLLGQKYAALEGKLTKLQIQAEADKLSAKMRGKKVACKGIIQEVYPPDPLTGDPDACKVVVALVGVAGFTAPELPAINYVVPRAKALPLKLRGPVTITGRLYALDQNGTVAIELDAPPGWRDPEAGGSGGGGGAR